MKDQSTYLKALLNDDTEQILHIYKNCFPNVKRFIVQNNGEQADAEDIFQKALLQLTVRYRKEAFDITSSFEAYLFTVCKNLWRRELNKSKQEVTIDGVVELKNEAREIALSSLEQERWEFFQEKLELISENCKQILDRFFKKMAYKDIAIELEYNDENVVRQRVFKCKSKLTEIIRQDNRFNELKEI
ncbi:sigma-70 family RNA polymerase sigma factor [Lacinutrix neustonica]|uniref:Sigma-70 family RNA polymerase sigma factor n=1 Tax=Lacinutrix neustonica TaxID=2980107 RepID=A0A9E8MXZ8_9FLAO|nr:sigma-70 family RNA polymerase sigma factor [Lacinutrix neustonica]WAC03623.1 sigma-70 family RNA polymerase sigma factor [Lacinutrix neustonica]